MKQASTRPPNGRASRAKSPEEIRQLAEAWYGAQVEKLSRLHGAEWPKYREWLESYLRGELRKRLFEIGWRRSP